MTKKVLELITLKERLASSKGMTQAQMDAQLLRHLRADILETKGNCQHLLKVLNGHWVNDFADSEPFHSIATMLAKESGALRNLDEQTTHNITKLINQTKLCPQNNS
jgi:hypothetical protein